MSIAEFEAMPRQLSWDYAYEDGMAHITPREGSVVEAVLAFTEPIPENGPSLTLRPLDPSRDEQALLDLYFIAFHDVFEFCDWPLEEILQQAADDIAKVLKNFHPLATSIVEDTESGAMIGAMLIDEDGSALRHLMIDPEWQRQGVATAMLHHVTSTLLEKKTSLRSRYAIGNEPSREWHKRMGFAPIKD